MRAGGVGCVEHIRNPVRAAKKILTESPHVYFVGTGAERFAQEHGIELCPNEELIIEREVERLREAKKQGYLKMPDEFGPMRSHDTVGAVALDARRQHRGGDFHRRHAEQGSRTGGRFVADRLRLLRRQSQCRGVDHRLGRAHDEAGAGQVDCRPRRERHRRRKTPRNMRCTT